MAQPQPFQFPWSDTKEVKIRLTDGSVFDDAGRLLGYVHEFRMDVNQEVVDIHTMGGGTDLVRGNATANLTMDATLMVPQVVTKPTKRATKKKGAGTYPKTRPKVDPDPGTNVDLDEEFEG
jgi:hypothetical protein